MLGKKSLVWIIFIFMISFVCACDNDADCDDGEACDVDGNCVEYCKIGIAECSDGIDNDGDGLTDYPDDPECRSPYDTDEMYDPACANGIDDDGDGLTDYPNDTFCGGPESLLEGPLGFSSAPSLSFWDWLKDLLTFWN
jgi:hypothetical protein